MERLQKVIAQSGVASRRKAEELILAKKVMVNGEVVSELGVKVSDKDEVIVKKSNLIGGVFDLNATPDALPILAVACLFLPKTSKLINVPQARLKDVDIISSMVKELIKIEIVADSTKITYTITLGINKRKYKPKSIIYDTKLFETKI